MEKQPEPPNRTARIIPLSQRDSERFAVATSVTAVFESRTAASTRPRVRSRACLAGNRPGSTVPGTLAYRRGLDSGATQAVRTAEGTLSISTDTAAARARCAGVPNGRRARRNVDPDPKLDRCSESCQRFNRPSVEYQNIIGKVNAAGIDTLFCERGRRGLIWPSEQSFAYRKTRRRFASAAVQSIRIALLRCTYFGCKSSNTFDYRGYRFPPRPLTYPSSPRRAKTIVLTPERNWKYSMAIWNGRAQTNGAMTALAGAV